MSFVPSISLSTVNGGKDLQVTDTSTYGPALGSLSKTSFVSRTLILTRYDGITQSLTFPYTNQNDTLADQLLIPGYFVSQVPTAQVLDLIVTVSINFIYSSPSGNQAITISKVYQSRETILTSLINMCLTRHLNIGDQYYADSPYNQTRNTKTMATIINLVEASKGKILFGDLISAQKLLTAAYNLCPVTPLS